MSERNDDVTINTKLRELRLARGYTQGAVAAAVGVTRGAVTLWESGDPAVRTKPSRATLVRLAELYDVSVDDLIHGTHEEPPNTRGATGEHLVARTSHEAARLARMLETFVQLDRDNQRATIKHAQLLLTTQ